MTQTISPEAEVPTRGRAGRQFRAQQRLPAAEAAKQEARRQAKLVVQLKGRGMSDLRSRSQQAIIDAIGSHPAFRWNVICTAKDSYAARHAKWTPSHPTIEGTFEEVLAQIMKYEGK